MAMALALGLALGTQLTAQSPAAQTNSVPPAVHKAFQQAYPSGNDHVRFAGAGSGRERVPHRKR